MSNIILDWLEAEDPKQKKKELAFAYHRAKIEELRNLIDPSLLRGKRRPTRFFFENEYITGGYMKVLPKLCTIVYGCILKHGNTKTQIAWPSFKTIIDETGEKNRNYIGNAIRLLVECGVLGLIQGKKGFKTLNLYYFPSVQFWKPVKHIKGRLKLTDSFAQYPNPPLRSIRKRRNRGINVDTLTNQINNSPNSVTSIADILRRRLNKLNPPEAQGQVAIQDDSLHSVVEPRYEGQNDQVLPVNTGNLREDRSIQPDTTQSG